MDERDPSTWTFEYKRSIYLRLLQQREMCLLVGNNTMVPMLDVLKTQLPTILDLSETEVAEIVAFGQAEDERLRATLVNLGLQVRT